MGIFSGINALSARILAGGTIAMGLLQFGQWGIISPVMLIAAGAVFWRYAGYRHQQTFLRRGIVGGFWLLTTMVAIGHGVGG